MFCELVQISDSTRAFIITIIINIVMDEMEGEDVQAGSRSATCSTKCRMWATRQQKHTQLHAVFYKK